MNKPRSNLRDVLALCGWLVIAYWGGLSYFHSPTAVRTEPTPFRAEDLITYYQVSGGLLLVIAVSFAAAAIARLVQRVGPLAPPAVSLAIAIGLILAFVLFVLWARVITDRQGMLAGVLLQAPYFMAAVGIMFSRRRRLES